MMGKANTSKDKMIENLEKDYLTMTMAQIAEKYGVTKRIVQYWTEKFNLSKYKKLTVLEKDMIASFYKPWEGNSELATKLNMSNNALASAYKRLKTQTSQD